MKIKNPPSSPVALPLEMIFWSHDKKLAFASHLEKTALLIRQKISSPHSKQISQPPIDLVRWN